MNASGKTTVRFGTTIATVTAIALAAVAATGCTLTDLNPAPPQTPAEQAASIERTRCGPDVDEARLVPLVTGKAIDTVEPLYTRSGAGRSGAEARLYGAVIRVKAAPGVTAEWLDRALECHGARRMLERLPAETIANDPFWLPGRVVDIDAESARDSFAVAVRAENVDDAQEILIRATTFFAASQREVASR